MAGKPECRKHRTRQFFRRMRCRIKRRQLRQLKVLAVTGSCGKTTTASFLHEIISDYAPCVGGIHGNDENSVMRSVRQLTPEQVFLVQEVSGHQPGQLGRVLPLLKHDVGIVTTVGHDHYRSFRSLENTAAEKGNMVELLPENGVAVLNADDPNVAPMASRTTARVITYGVGPEADVRATDVQADWPERLSMTVTYGGEQVRIETNLFGDLLITSVLAAVSGALAVGYNLKQCADSLRGIETFPRRMSIHRSAQGIWFVMDSCKAPLWSVWKIISMMEAVSAPRTTLVFGSFSDVTGAASDQYRRVAREALKVVDRVLFVGENAKYIRKRITSENKHRLLAIESLPEAICYLKNDRVQDELIFVKSSSRDHLERVMYGQSDEFVCQLKHCEKLISCDHCEQSGIFKKEEGCCGT